MLRNRFFWILGAVMAAPVFLLSGLDAQTKDSGPAVQDGFQVSFEYSLKDDEGNQIETNKGKAPLTYTHGQKEIIPGLEDNLEGMRVGDEKSIRVAPKDAYGEINPAAFKEVPREKIPADALKVGTVLAARGPGGRTLPVRVYEVKDKTVVLDMNHPLAGKTLVFDVKIMEVQAKASK